MDTNYSCYQPPSILFRSSSWFRKLHPLTFANIAGTAGIGGFGASLYTIHESKFQNKINEEKSLQKDKLINELNFKNRILEKEKYAEQVRADQAEKIIDKLFKLCESNQGKPKN